MKKKKSDCCINLALEVFGDQWTLLIIRDIMFDGKRYFREMLNSNEKIASNILTDRLNKLERLGVLIKTSDKQHKQKLIYTLTKKGIDLMPVMIQVGYWSVKHMPASEKDKSHIGELVEGGDVLQRQLQKELILEFTGVAGLPD